jgi:hypothetical protein
VAFLDEPNGLEEAFRGFSQRRIPSPKEWADSYLLAFASAAGLKLVTFDQALRGKAKSVLVLSN